MRDRPLASSMGEGKRVIVKCIFDIKLIFNFCAKIFGGIEKND